LLKQVQKSKLIPVTDHTSKEYNSKVFARNKTIKTEEQAQM